MKTCSNTSCNKQFIPVNKQQLYCSPNCGAAYRASIRQYSRKCLYCSEIFSGSDSRQKYCTRSCAASVNNVLRASLVSCKWCNIDYPRSKNNMDFCSIQCRREDQISRWIKGELVADTKYGHASFVRVFLFRRSNNSCELCGFNKLSPDGSSILQVDHIDGNWKNNCVENLRLICPNCHAMTDNWCAKNKGYGREWRRKS